MASRNRLTNNSDETELGGLLAGDCVFSIPYFQRAYKWKSERINQLQQDILNIVDGETDFHFLGAVIIHGKSSNPSDPKTYDVIDGQQRITTLIIFLCAMVKFLWDNGQHDVATGLFLKYLLVPRNTTLLSNYKLHSCKEDRRQLNSVYADILADPDFKNKIGSLKIKKLPDSGDKKGPLLNNYHNIIRFLKKQFESEGLSRITDIYGALLEKMSVVQIDVWDPTNGPKIFDSLNSRQEPMTIGDLVRNEIFSKIAAHPVDEIERIDQNTWQPFYQKFKKGEMNLFDSYFFPYGLIIDHNLRKSEVYARLRKEWQDQNKNPEQIVADLSRYQNAFIDITCGSNEMGHSHELKKRFRNLWLSDIPSSTYPFLMQLSGAIKEGTVNESIGTQILDVLESFLVRRAICGHEPTGLHAVFKRLWADISTDIKGQTVKDSIKTHKTVTWPNDVEVRNALLTRPLYGAGITKYILIEYDLSLGGDSPVNKPWIEHVLPQKPEISWYSIFTEKQQEEMKDLIGNLVLLSSEMNGNLGNKSFLEKKIKYLHDSMFKSARDLATQFQEWNPESINMRGQEISDWAILRWKY